MSSENPDRPLLASTWAELRRRKVVRAAVAYGFVAWVVLQMGEITFEPLGLPPWFLTWTILVVILAFPVVLVLAWVFDRGEGGFSVDRSGPGVRGPARVFAALLVLVTVVALAWWLTDIYGDQDEPAPAIVASGNTRASPALPHDSIAVLPFQDMSPNQDQGWFADGIAEELLDRLARIQGLRVAARTSSFALRDSALDVTGIGRALQVGLVLEGSVRKAGGRLRITAQLIDANNGYHLWTETFEREDRDIFELQDEITQEIVEQLRPRIPELTTKAEVDTRTADAAEGARNPLAHELYLQGRLHWRQRTPGSLRRAVELFEQALTIDPEHARAWCGLADSHLLLADYGAMALPAAIEQAEPAIVQALTLAPGLGEAWASLGLMRSLAGQLDAAEGNLLEAARLDPNYEMALMWLGGVYARQGRFAARAEVLERARQLSPLDPAINVNLANSQLTRGDIDAARATLTGLLETIPDHTLVRRSLAELERQTGHLAAALAHADRAWRQDPDAPSSVATLISTLTSLQRYDEAERVLQRLPASSPIRPMHALIIHVQRDPAAPLPLELRARIDQVLDAVDQPVSESQGAMLQMAAFAEYWGGDRDRERLLRVLDRLLESSAGTLSADQLEFAQIHVHLLRQLGRDDESASLREQIRRTHEHLESQRLGGAMAYYSIGASHAMEGRAEPATQYLERAIKTAGFSELWLLRSDPRWLEIADQPAFQRLLQGLETHVAAEREASRAIASY